ncbi:MAG: NifU family protein [Candidatus Baltobacteraceae bacterium]
MGERALDGGPHARPHERLRTITTETPPKSLAERVNAAIDKVRPGIAMDGGEVWLIKVENGVAYVQMLGACGGCSMANTTLKFAIESTVMAECPEITEVLQV